MAIICPTITASNPHTYREQMERVAPFAKRLHVDFADGDFAPTKLVPPNQAWLPAGYEVDLHVMYRRPAEEIETLIYLEPNLVIFHVESDGNLLGLIREVKPLGIRAGVALLPNSQPEDFAFEIEEADHVLIFGGKLGYHGGDADLSQLDKIERIKSINPYVELGWDGGGNANVVPKLAAAGIETINVGSAIHKASRPDEAYAIMTEELTELNG